VSEPGQPSATRLLGRLFLGLLLGAGASFQAYSLLNQVLEGEGGWVELLFGLNALVLLVFVLKFIGDGLA
jgi:hypothetical protein